MSEAIAHILAWLAPIVAGLLTIAGQLWLNQRFSLSDDKREQEKAATEAKRKAEAEWRASVTGKIDNLTDATQTTMRATLLHYIEKYLTRGWLTPEERAALVDMHSKYSALNANGLIDGYMARIAELPDREI